MKKLLTLIAIIIGISAVSAHAASGDIAGKYYSTDIRTYVNGYEIEAINIGGQTLIKAEDMKYYSFSVYWDADAHALDIGENAHPSNGAVPSVAGYTQTSGTPLGNYYETDIVTRIDGHEITAYNTGGITYIWAEQMRDFGYEVIWNEADRTLKITSPQRAGYEYDIFLSSGNKPDGDWYDASSGAFSIVWKNGTITGKGDAKLFHAGIGYDGIRYLICVQFYQGDGLFYSGTLREKLENMLYYDRGVYLADPEEKLEYIRQNMTVKINGNKAENITATGGGGNGHTDYYFEITDLPKIKESDLKEIEFSLGDTSGMEEYAIEKPVYTVGTEIDKAIESLKKSSEDYEQFYYTTDDYFAIHMEESQSWGVYKDALYIYDRKIGKASDDILEQVRAITGFHYDIIHPFAEHVGDVKTNLFFSCSTQWKTGDFYCDMLTGKVYTVATQTHYLPEIPNTGRQYYVIYKEGYRDNRIELAAFDADSALAMDGNVLGADGYSNDIKYYLDGDKWVEFEQSYERVSNNATEILDSNIEIINTAQ